VGIETRLILCDAARSAGGRLHVLGAGPPDRLYGPRRSARGALAGLLLDVPRKQLGSRIRIAAQLGTSDHFDADSWEPVRVDGRPVRIQRSVPVERPPGGSARGPLNVPFAFELPTANLGRAAYAWRVTVAGDRVLVPAHDRLDPDVDWDPLPKADLFMCDAASVVDDRLDFIAGRSNLTLAPSATSRWSLAGRLTIPLPDGSDPVERVQLTAELDAPSGQASGAKAQRELELRRPAESGAGWVQVEAPVALDLPSLELSPGRYAWSVDAGDFVDYIQFTVAG
jgi:hypothetical protein